MSIHFSGAYFSEAISLTDTVIKSKT